jgi:hypothetical protein
MAANGLMFLLHFGIWLDSGIPLVWACNRRSPIYPGLSRAVLCSTGMDFTKQAVFHPIRLVTQDPVRRGNSVCEGMTCSKYGLSTHNKPGKKATAHKCPSMIVECGKSSLVGRMDQERVLVHCQPCPCADHHLTYG